MGKKDKGEVLVNPGVLHREITLGKCNLFLTGITVLGYEVTGIAGEKDIFNIPFPTFGNRYRFVGVNKMI